MSRPTTFFLGLMASSFLALSACQPATETSETAPTSPTPPALSEEAAAPEAPETPAAVEVTAPEEAEPVAEAKAEADHDHDHDHDKHDDDKHDHDEHDHSDHAGGEAHVHGHADLAITRDGNVITVSLEAPLDNFGLPETETDLGDTSVYSDQAVNLIGGECLRTETGVSARSNGNHGQMTIDLTYTCDDASVITGVDVTAFSAFAGFSEVDAVVLTEDGQTAATLTPSKTSIDFP